MITRFILLLLAMIFMHILADYNLQGPLAKMKQKQWWKEQICDTFLIDQYDKLFEEKWEIYKDDYKISLATHCLQWSICISLPSFIYYYLYGYENEVGWLVLIISMITNAVVHYKIDDLKANKFAINLVQDQMFHYLQIVTAWLVTIITAAVSYNAAITLPNLVQ